jgi:speckle-type POZ protein
MTFDNKFSLSLNTAIPKHMNDVASLDPANPHNPYLEYRLKKSIVFEIKLHSSVRLLDYPIKVKMAISDEKQKNIYEKTTDILANTPFPVKVFEMTKKELLGNFESGEMIISCHIESMIRDQLGGNAADNTDSKSLDNEPAIISINNNQFLILNRLEEMFEKMSLSDVTFNIKGQTFAAHKAILAMTSPVFAAMFSHPTKEVLSGQVEVKDVDPDVFQEILRFIYTAGRMRSTVMDKFAPGLLAAADKYLLEELKIQCETHLINQMSAENCLELLSLTAHHPAEHLKKNAIEYFRHYPGKST